eukprot:1060816-Alexandrium_andersonii.AAC.1
MAVELAKVPVDGAGRGGAERPDQRLEPLAPPRFATATPVARQGIARRSRSHRGRIASTGDRGGDGTVVLVCLERHGAVVKDSAIRNPGRIRN